MGRRGVKKQRRRDSDSYSSMSAPATVDKKTPRFSLRRLFAGRTLSAMSNRSRASLDIEAHSELSLSNSQLDKIDLVTTDSIPLASTSQPSPTVRGALTCPLCISEQPCDNFPLLMTCPHRSCRDCLKQYLRIEITESRVNISCPECSERLHPGDIKVILADDSLMHKYEEFMLRRVLVSDPDARWCPAPDCGYAVIASGCAGCPKLKCERPGCGSHFCYHCKQFWHPNLTCDAARARRSPSLAVASGRRSMSSAEAAAEIKPCPRCSACIMKMDDGSCNHMTCAVCGAEFCWLCMKEISDLHYLSPSGCTFWGKKPWSRKKKILWQLGTLVGAPVGIGLIASIAVPAMIIGIPIWVARKLHAKYEAMPRHKRNAIITGGVMASVIVSPVVAGLAVGVGVPILLAYVYGVVPISLCRSSGGCGVKTTESGGVRFEFDDDNDVTVGISTGVPSGDSHSIEVNSQHAITEPSIGPSIGEASVDMSKSLSASGCHVDRIGIVRDESDRDSASNRAIAGASLNGSLSGSTVLAHRLEVHADVATCQKRASISSDSANLSMSSEKSHNVTMADNLSTKALAGSIGGNRDISSAIIPCADGQSDHLRRRNSGSSNLTVVSHYRNSSNHGSPVSGRSVSFSGDETRTRRTKKPKRCSFSGVDRSAADSGERVEKLSIGSSDLDTDHGDMPSVRLGGGDDRKVGSFESVESRTVISTTVATLTQVEVDRPQYAVRTITKTVKEDSGLLEGQVLCNIVEEKKAEGLGMDESQRVRRLSWEMALQEGRLPFDVLTKAT